MKLLSAGVLSATLTVGLVGSVAAYRSQVGDDPDVERPAVVDAAPAPKADRPEPRVRWAPCAEGSTLERGVCVTDVVRTHVLPAPVSAPATAPVAAPVSAPAQAPASASPPVRVRDDSGNDDEAEDRAEARDDDDDHEDSDHDDEDHEDD